jgi:hypothetical protein
VHVHTHTHTHSRTPLISDWFIAETTTHMTHNKHNRQIFMPSVGFKPGLPAIKQLQTYASDSTVTGIGTKMQYSCQI